MRQTAEKIPEQIRPKEGNILVAIDGGKASSPLKRRRDRTLEISLLPSDEDIHPDERPVSFPCFLYEAKIDGENKISIPLDWKDYPRILYFKGGEYRLSVNLQEYVISEECLCFVNPGEMMKLEAISKEGQEYALAFKLDILQFLRQDESQKRILAPIMKGMLTFSRFITMSQLGFSEITRVINGIVERFRVLGEKSPSLIKGSIKYNLPFSFDQLLIKADMLRLVALLEAYGLIKESKEEEDKQVKAIKNSIKYIEENYSRKIYVGDLAKLSELNEQYFIRFFGNALGYSPLEYINHYRIEKAKEFLMREDLLVYEVANMCGFRNIGNFIKIFKTYTGLTPHKYRKVIK